MVFAKFALVFGFLLWQGNSKPCIPQCGVGLIPAGRSFNGEEADIRHHPYALNVSVLRLNGEPDFGTATLIGDRWAITAGHVVTFFNSASGQRRSASQVKVTIGWNSADEEVVEGDFIVAKDFMEDSDDFFSPNDVALIKLQKRVQISRNVDFACVSSSPHPDGQTFALVGFGDTQSNFDNEQLSETLRLETFLANTDEHCEKLHSDLKEYPKRMFCANKYMTRLSAGDSGAAAYQTPANNVFLYGVYQGSYWEKKEKQGSWTTNDMQKQEGGDVFVEISPYCNWIAKKTDNEVKCRNPDEPVGCRAVSAITTF